MAGWGLAGTPQDLTPAAVGVLAVTLLVGVVLVYCVLLCLSASAFWFIHLQATLDIFESIFQAARYPVAVYPGWLQTFLSAVVPVGFAVSVPAEALVGRLLPTTLAAACALAACWLAFSRLVWRASLKRYTGASA